MSRLSRTGPTAVRALVLAVALAAVPMPATAQGGAIRGSVEDPEGRAIKGAVIKATNPAGRPETFTATTDARGRFAIIGLIGGLWSFTAEAPGFVPAQSASFVRSIMAGNTPVEFVLARVDLAPPGVLTRQIQEDLAEAGTLRAAGRLDQAIVAYQAIAERNSALTTVQLVLAETYRQKAAREATSAARASLLDLAVTAYRQVLTADPAHERAHIELAMTQVERGAFADAEQALGTLASQPRPSRDAVLALGEIRLGRGDLDAARQSFQEASSFAGAGVKPLLRLGLIASRQGQPEVAARYFQMVVTADPEGPDGVEARANLRGLAR